MKKILMSLNILLIGIIVFQACNSNKQDKTVDVTVNPKNECLNRFCKTASFDTLHGTLEAGIIKQLSESYLSDKGKGNINGNIKSPDALSVVFNIEKIKTIIHEMQEQACLKGCVDNLTKLGIRFYFVKYPGDLGSRNDGLRGLPAENNNKHSLVMVPVYKSKVNGTWGDWYDYNLWTVSGSNCFDPIWLGQPDKKLVARGILPDGGDNHGGIGPPPEPGTYPTNSSLQQ
jgi:hypothetical protein